MYSYQREHGRRDEGGLSVLAQGKGLLDGGVEVECYPDFRHSLSLSVRPNEVTLFLSPLPSFHEQALSSFFCANVPSYLYVNSLHSFV